MPHQYIPSMQTIGSMILALVAWAGPAFAQPTLPADRRVPGLDGSDVELKAPQGGVLAIVFLWSECPISNRYAPTLQAMSGRWPSSSVTFVGLFVDPDRPLGALKTHADEYALAFPLARDPGSAVAKELGVEIVPTAVVIDDRGRVRYRGRVDDQFYALGKNRPAATSHEFRDAIDAILAGRPVATPETEAVGCTLPVP